MRSREGLGVLYQPNEEPERGRPHWVRVVALVLVLGMVVMTAGAAVQMLLLGI